MKVSAVVPPSIVASQKGSSSLQRLRFEPGGLSLAGFLASSSECGCKLSFWCSGRARDSENLPF